MNEVNDTTEEKTTAKIEIALDNKYFFTEIPNNYTISYKTFSKRLNKDLLKHIGFFTTVESALKYYVKHCTRTRKSTTVDELLKAFARVDKNIKKVVGPVSDAKRRYEVQNEHLKVDIKKALAQSERYKTMYYNLKNEGKDAK